MDYQKILSNYERSGLSVAQYCKRRGIKETTLRYQLKRAREINRSTESNKFTPIQISSVPITPPLRHIIITLPDSTRIEIPV